MAEEATRISVAPHGTDSNRCDSFGNNYWPVVKTSLTLIVLYAMMAKAAIVIRGDAEADQAQLLSFALSVDLLVVLWVIFRWRSDTTIWWTYLVTFLSFGVMAFRSLFVGTTCACFGPRTNPVWPSVVDCAAVGGLLLTKRYVFPRAASGGGAWQWLWNELKVNRAMVATSVVIAVAIALGGYCLPVRRGVLAMAGYTVVPDRFVKAVAADSDSDTVKSAVFSLHNASDSPTIVFGAQTSCNCLSTTKLPVTIPPRSDVDFAVTVDAKYSRQDDRVRLFLNAPSRPIILHVTSRRRAQ